MMSSILRPSRPSGAPYWLVTWFVGSVFCATVALSNARRMRNISLNARGGLLRSCCLRALRMSWRSAWISAAGYVRRKSSKQSSPSFSKRVRHVSARCNAALCWRALSFVVRSAVTIANSASSGWRRSCFAKKARARLRAIGEESWSVWLSWVRNSGLRGRRARCPGLSAVNCSLSLRISSACRLRSLRLGGLIDCASWVIVAARIHLKERVAQWRMAPACAPNRIKH